MLVPGAIVEIRTPQGSYNATVGTTELGKQTPPDASTHFRIASNSKTMTAALIVLLAQDGKLNFSDPVSDYVPDVPNGAHITVADLLKMRSGLYNYTSAPEFSAQLDADPGKAWTPQEVLAIAFAHPPNAAPDTAYEYNNTNYALLGLIAEKAGGRPCQSSSRTGCSDRSGCSRHRFRLSTTRRFPPRTRTATCTAAPLTRWSTTPTPPT